MPPGTPDVKYEVLKPRVKPLGSTTLGEVPVPVVNTCRRLMGLKCQHITPPGDVKKTNHGVSKFCCFNPQGNLGEAKNDENQQRSSPGVMKNKTTYFDSKSCMLESQGNLDEAKNEENLQVSSPGVIRDKTRYIDPRSRMFEPQESVGEADHDGHQPNGVLSPAGEILDKTGHVGTKFRTLYPQESVLQANGDATSPIEDIRDRTRQLHPKPCTSDPQGNVRENNSEDTRKRTSYQDLKSASSPQGSLDEAKVDRHQLKTPAEVRDNTAPAGSQSRTLVPQGSVFEAHKDVITIPEGILSAQEILHSPVVNPLDLHGSIFGGKADPGDGARLRESMHDPGEWLRPLGKFEVLMAMGGYFGSLNTVQALRLACPCPIMPQDVRAALTVLARRTELLQCCVSWRRLWPWFRRRTHVYVPFRVHRGDVMTAYYRTLEAPYSMGRGPLWRACLVPEAPLPGGVHRAVLILAVHHCLTDAFTNSTLCRELLTVLNHALRGRRYLPPPRPLPPALSDQLVGTRELLAAAAFTAYKYYTTTLGNFNARVYFDDALPTPPAHEARQARTRVLHTELTEEATAQLVARCRRAGVTVHALISTLAQLAILYTGRAYARTQPQETTVRVFNCVNMRRYFAAQYRDAPGCYISIEEEVTRVRLQDGASGEALWALAGRVHHALRHSLQEARQPVRTLASFAPCAALIPLNHMLTRLGARNRNDNHVITTNMGDLRQLLGTCDGPVTPTHLLRCVSDALTGHPYTLVFHTFLGRFSLCLEYYTNKTHRSVAATFFALLTDLIADVAVHGAPVHEGGVHRRTALHQDKFCPEHTHAHQD